MKRRGLLMNKIAAVVALLLTALSPVMASEEPVRLRDFGLWRVDVVHDQETKESWCNLWSRYLDVYIIFGANQNGDAFLTFRSNRWQMPKDNYVVTLEIGNDQFTWIARGEGHWIATILTVTDKRRIAQTLIDSDLTDQAAVHASIDANKERVAAYFLGDDVKSALYEFENCNLNLSRPPSSTNPFAP
jgi:hypothetical protein